MVLFSHFTERQRKPLLRALVARPPTSEWWGWSWTPALLTRELHHTPLSAWLMGPSSHLLVQSLASRLKENMEKLTEERDQRIAAENREKEQNKRLQRQLRDTKEEMGELTRKEAEASRKKHELVMPPTPGAPSW